jgi:hypothetical protein
VAGHRGSHLTKPIDVSLLVYIEELCVGPGEFIPHTVVKVNMHAGGILIYACVMHAQFGGSSLQKVISARNVVHVT